MCEKTIKSNRDNRDESNDIPHIVSQLNNDLYAIPVKRKNQKSLDEIDHHEINDDTVLPAGWEKHEGRVFEIIDLQSLCCFVLDNDGPYYWHIKSGTIQREIPLISNTEKSNKVENKSSFKETTESLISKFENCTTSVTRSSTSSALDLDCDDRKRKEELALK